MATPQAEANIAAQAQLRALIAATVANAWADLPSYNDADVPGFLTRVVPVVLAGQRQAAALTDAYIASALNRRPLGIDPVDVTGATARKGTSPDVVYRRPFVTVWTGLKNGTPYKDAVAAGQARAESAAAMDVQLAHRATLAAIQQADKSIFGYKRVADPGACAYCQAVDGAYVKNADAMALHNHCGCGLEPLTDAHSRAVRLPDGTRIRDFPGGPLIATPPPDTVAVHEHGELGLVLTDPADKFTSL